MKLPNVLKVILWAMGGFLLVAKDFEGPDVPSEELRERMYIRRRRMVRKVALLLMRVLCLSQHPNASEEGDVEQAGTIEKEDIVSAERSAGKDENLDQNTITGTTITPTPTIRLPMATSELPQQPLNNHSSRSHHHGLLSGSLRFLKQVLTPCTVVLLLSFVISLIDPLKALFIPPSSNFQPHFRPVAPDGGQPPLAFIFDAATFVSGASIPLGLVCLGSAFASLSLGSGELFPKGAVASFALGKMVLIPILGVALTRGFVHVGFVNRDDKVMQFVCCASFHRSVTGGALY
jgi:predicted permease